MNANTNIEFNTLRLKCRPLSQKEYSSFWDIVTTDTEVQKYFDFDKNFLDRLQEETFHAGIYLKSTGKFIGLIYGFPYFSDELWVEFFISEPYRSQRYMGESLTAYMDFSCWAGKITTFRFDIEESNTSSINFIEKMGGIHFEEEDFVNAENKKKFLVYKIFWKK